VVAEIVREVVVVSMSPATLPASVRIETGAVGLPRLAIKNRHGSAELYLHGAHLTAWHPASTSAPVIWLSRESLFQPDKAIRGGVPICFPWFGAHATDKTAPAHGFARLREWTLVDATEDADGIVTLTLELATQDAFQATYRVTIGPSLTMSLEVSNVGNVPFTFEEALHTYFDVQDVRHVIITGLEDTEFLDKVTGFTRRRQGPTEAIGFVGETDRVYLNTQTTCDIHDPDRRRTIVVRKTGSDTTVVWNPWIDKARAMSDFGDDEWPEMVCVETCNVNAYARTLAPGERHTMTAIIDVRNASF
jgi:glucose-6-phosphate 1-epimerase